MEKLVRHSIVIASLFCGTIYAYEQGPGPRQISPQQYYQQQSNQNIPRGYGQYSQPNPGAGNPYTSPSNTNSDADDNDDFDGFDDNDSDDDADDEEEMQARFDAFKLIFDNLRSAKLSGQSLALEYEFLDGKKVELELPSISTDLKFDKSEGNHTVTGVVDAKVKTEFTEGKDAKPMENQGTLHAEGALKFSSWDSMEQLMQNPTTAQNAHITLDLSKYSWNSDFTAYEGKGLFAFDRKEGNNVVNYVEDSKINLTSKYDEFLKSMVKTQIEESDRQDLKDNIADWLSLVPKPSTWGEIKNDHAIDVNFNTSPAGDPVNLSVNVKKSRVTVGSYGLDWNLNLLAKQSFQDVNLNSNVNLMNYKPLINELAAYANRWITVSNKTAKEGEKVPLIDDKDIAEVVDLFKKFSKNPAEDLKDWITSINYTNSTGFRIGTLNSDQAAAEFNRVKDRLQAKFSTGQVPAEQIPEPSMSGR